MTGLIGEPDSAQQLSYLYVAFHLLIYCSSESFFDSQLVWSASALNYFADLRRVRRTTQPAKKNPEFWFNPKMSPTACSWRLGYAKKMGSRSNKVYSSDIYIGVAKADIFFRYSDSMDRAQ